MRSTYRLLGACAFTSMASMRVCDSLLPAMASDFSATVTQMAGAISLFALAYGLLQLFYGPMGDRFGKLRVIAAATLMCTVGSSASFFAQDIAWLVGSRAVSGAAAAGIIPLTMAWIGDQVTYDERQAVLAKLLAATVFGMIAGQWVGGMLGDLLHWRAAFGILALMFLVLGVLLLRQARMIPAVQTAAQPRSVRATAKLLTQRWPRRLLAVTLLEGMFAFSALAFIPVYLQVRFGLSMSSAGAVAALYGTGGLVYSAFARRLVARLREEGLARTGGTTLGVALATIALAPSWWVAAPACLFAGFGFHALHNTLQTGATQMAPAARGTAMAFFASCQFLGQAVGVSLAAVIVDRISHLAVFIASAAALPLLAIVFARELRCRNQECPA